MVTVKGVNLSYNTIKNYIINVCIVPEISKESRKKVIMSGLTNIAPIVEYLITIRHDNGIDEGFYDNDIGKLSVLLSQIKKRGKK